MKIELINKLDGLTMYGDIPCLPVEIKNGEGERFVGEENDSWLLLEDFVYAIDEVCLNELDYGDVDYFDVEKCKILINWLQGRRAYVLPPRLQVLYDQMELYMRKAIIQGTGVIIEL